MTRLLLCTDLDRTLIPNGPQPESARARELFQSLAARPEVVLAYVSGRDRSLVERAIRNYCLPQPAFVIADVGTSIYRIDEAQAWQAMDTWSQQIGKDWEVGDHPPIEQLLSGIRALRLQEYSKQNRFKLSYYIPLNENRNRLEKEILAILGDAGYRSRLIWSTDEPANIGLLDIIPETASKLHAIRALQQELSIKDSETVFCGDSGNDLEVLVSSVPAVLVANSSPEVQEQALKDSALNGYEKKLYIASGHQGYLNGFYSAGMLEGILHFYPDIQSWIDLPESSGLDSELLINRN